MAIDTQLLNNLFRVGRVSDVFPATMRVKVEFPSRDNMVSHELPVLVHGSSKNAHYWLPDVGEQVLCLVLPDGAHNDGFCLGSYYSEAMPPKVASIDKRRLDFGDGTYIEYDRGSHQLTVQCVGDVVINGATINLN